jgi:hypothetical protein
MNRVRLPNHRPAQRKTRIEPRNRKILRTVERRATSHRVKSSMSALTASQVSGNACTTPADRSMQWMPAAERKKHQGLSELPEGLIILHTVVQRCIAVARFNQPRDLRNNQQTRATSRPIGHKKSEVTERDLILVHVNAKVLGDNARLNQLIRSARRNKSRISRSSQSAGKGLGRNWLTP